MQEDIYAQKLAWFKENERPEAVLLVADDPERIKFAVAWSNLEVKRAEELTQLRGESVNEEWAWLWENVRFSRTEFMEKVGVFLSESGFEGKLGPLIGNRVLYPDGTVNSFVQRYLREQVLKLFDAKPTRPPRKR